MTEEEFEKLSEKGKINYSADEIALLLRAIRGAPFEKAISRAIRHKLKVSFVPVVTEMDEPKIDICLVVEKARDQGRRFSRKLLIKT